ncbi:bifunctional diaminohydroxyphosphoribosylaminopyrimidine deaminase/5-amino-6-(5-phosphoribosylamino)uracil reductase RibD [Methylomarinum sp. Ch1-1]|uniref:Riboflavin biosynthesis protein RibD n=1 Tax=Methylomarinum roseum TaxID=3067653 RepID=A0AAU7NPZ3_9GAMM|nr:bifunctional diaminohydroxyphosphoribosylaminopyrimidine deaminase/5-amino-6-(5-phosphoribosylamino)uracil reductase RibD [Methylomarinum sp. Ch1-1]MDP4521031.1 bifunctional diaminohydroxyphosphoribosylaminopyrimidine deaminase/5-amino-6-(5-phosphoribosylamino)uracil reductase RibD [Methylomarinum sp. Ch1-1]
MTDRQDAVYMARAIELAKKGLYTTDPNPRVGCVLVKGQRVIAEGWHRRAGCGHAEVEALAKTDQAQGATAYVTLEPCSHHGRTGPCSEALINAGVARVVVAMQDPNPLVGGDGIRKLRAAGIDVVTGVLQQDAEQLNRGFIKRMTQGYPFIRSKMAMSLDGRTAMASGESKWITSEQARADVQRFRAESSAILTGINTVLADDPRLNVRLDQEVEQPVRVVLDSALQLPLDARMLADDAAVWVVTCSHDQDKIRRLEDAGVVVLYVEEKQGRPNLAQTFAALAQQQINNVWVEAGATLNGALMNTELVDEWLVYMAPCLLGDQARGLLHLPDLTRMAERKNLQMTSVRQVGPDLRLTFTVHN